jgi:hypothetical protein
MRIITLTKQGTMSSSEAAPQGDGAPANYEIVTTRQNLVDSIHEAIEECFSDWRVSGPRPPGITVSYLVAEVLERVSRQENRGR